MQFEAEYYQILGVKSNATDVEIKQAFKKKAMELHPDKNRNDPKATEKFQQLNEAYETLKDPEKKKKYDLSHQPKKQTSNYSSTIDDILRQFFKQKNTFFNQKRSYTSHNFFFDDSDDSDDSDMFEDSDEFDDSDDDDEGDGLDTIFIGGLPKFTTEDDLLKAFSSYNPYRVKVVDQSSKPPFGFVQFYSPNQMRNAVNGRPNVYINGKICRAKPSHTNLYDHSARRGRF